MKQDSELKEEFVKQIKENEGIIHKVIGLYVDNPEDNKDLYQEVLLQAWKSYKNFKGKSKFSTWLYRVYLNTVLAFKRKLKPSEELKIENLNHETTKETKKERYEILYYLIKQLDEVDRMIMSLHLDGYANPEIGKITGMTNNHVTVKIHRLKTKIVEQFKKATDGTI